MQHQFFAKCGYSGLPSSSDADIIFSTAASVECYDKVMQLSPNSEAIFLAAWNNKGYAIYRAGKHSESVGCYHKVSEINPNFSCL
jgi:tetratricopeptide (TPR) repeat protein